MAPAPLRALGVKQMRFGVWGRVLGGWMTILLAGCNAYVSSHVPLFHPADGTYPFPPNAAIAAQTLTDDHVWAPIEGTGRLSLVDRSYRVTGPDDAAPSQEEFLVRRLADRTFIVQATRAGTAGTETAYGLIVDADAYYLFTFTRDGQNCASLSAAERARFNVAVDQNVCYVANLNDLTGLLLYLRGKFPYPTSMFTVRPM